MKLTKTLGLASAILLAAEAAQAAPIVLDFEGIGDGALVNDFYNGGTDSNGNSGTNYGITFSFETRGLVDYDAGGSGSFANEPSPDTVLYFSGSSAKITVAAGFDTGFSFFYASLFSGGSVTIYDGVDGTGTVLATLNLPANGSDCPRDPTGVYCAWVPVGIAFSGTARSVEFPSLILFDDVTFNSTTPGDTGVSVPEPGTLGLLGVGLAGLGLIRRHRQAA